MGCVADRMEDFGQNFSRLGPDLVSMISNPSFGAFLLGRTGRVVCVAFSTGHPMHCKFELKFDR